MAIPLRLLRWLCIPLLAIALAAAVLELLRQSFLSGLGWTTLLHANVLALSAGFLFRITLSWVFHRRGDPLEFIDTLEHELTHVLLGYLTFAPPLSLSASLKSGGQVKLKGSNPLVALSPYFFPLWCFLLLCVGFVVRPGLEATWNILIFFSLGWFCFRLGKEFRWYQTDLQIYGLVFSTLLAALLALLSLSAILHFRGILAWNWLGAVYPRVETIVVWSLSLFSAKTGSF